MFAKFTDRALKSFKGGKAKAVVNDFAKKFTGEDKVKQISEFAAKLKKSIDGGETA